MDQQLGPYVLKQELARGGQGAVYRAEGPEGPVALKLLLDTDPKAQLRFRQEAAVLLRTAHPNVLQAYSQGVAHGRHYLATELIDGIDLKTHVRKHGTQSEEVVRDWVRQVAEGLEHCHQLGLVHRDLKPANVILERTTGRLVIVDFGIVARDPAEFGRLSIDDYSKLSATGEIFGTPAYMAPEQADDRFGNVGPRTDVYGLGGLLYFLLCASAPYEGETVFQVFSRLLDGTREAPEPPGAPSDLRALCRSCLAKKPEDRPASAAAVAAALTRQTDSPSRQVPWGLLLGCLLAAGIGLGAAFLIAGQPRTQPDPARAPAGTPPEEPDPLAGLYRAAQSAADAEEFERAAGLYQRLLEEWPDDRPPDGRIAVALVRLERMDEALTVAERVLVAEPDSVEAEWARAHVFQERRDWPAALGAFERALELDPDSALARLSRGGLRKKLDDYAGAVEDLQLIESPPPHAQEALAECLSAVGRVEEAEALLDSILADHPKRDVRLRLLRATLRQARGDLRGALEPLTELLDLDPAHRGALRKRASLLLSLGELERAEVDVEAFAKLSPDPGAVAELRGRCHLHAGRLGQAAREFAEVLRNRPSSRARERVHIRLATTQLILGKLEGARGAIKAARRARPSSPWAQLWGLAMGIPADTPTRGPPWLDKLAASLAENDLGQFEALAEACPSARERTITLGLGSLRAQVLGKERLSLELARRTVEAGSAGVWQYELACLRLRSHEADEGFTGRLEAGLRELKNGDRENGLAILEHAVRLPGGEGTVVRAEALLHLKRYQQALTELKRVEEIGRPLGAKGWWMRGELKLRLEREGAEAALLQALKLDPTFSSTSLSLARLYELAKRPREECEALKRAVSLGYTELTQLDRLAHLQLALRDYVGARSTLGAIVEHHPSQREEATSKLVGVCLALGDLTGQELALTALHEHEPTKQRYLHDRAVVRMLQGRLEDAGRDIEALKALGHPRGGISELRGRLHLFAKEPREAVAAFKQALAELKGLDSYRVALLLGIAHHLGGDSTSALEAATLAEQAQPQKVWGALWRSVFSGSLEPFADLQPPKRAWAALSLRAFVSGRMELREQALAACTTAAQRSAVWACFGLLAERQSDARRALECYQRADRGGLTTPLITWAALRTRQLKGR